VDLVAPDASVFWVWLDGGLGRIALHREDDACVWLGEDAGQLHSAVPALAPDSRQA
jgi:hypothetical protein